MGGPLDRSLKVAFPEPTAVEAAGESTEAIPRLDVLGPIPSVEYEEKCYMYMYVSLGCSKFFSTTKEGQSG